MYVIKLKFQKYFTQFFNLIPLSDIFFNIMGYFKYVCPSLNAILTSFHSFLTLSNKVEKCLCIRFVCLSVCLRSNSRKYSSNVLKLIYVIYIWLCMNHTENGTDSTNGLSTETYKSFLKHYGQSGKSYKAYFNIFRFH